MFKDKIFMWVGLYGEIAGLVLIISVSIWDMVMLGFRKFYSFNIGFKGIIIIWIAVILICLSKHLDKTNWD